MSSNYRGLADIAHEIAAIEAEIARLKDQVARDNERYAENFDKFAFEDGAPIRNNLMDMYEKREKENRERIRQLEDRLQRARERQLKLIKPIY